MKFVIKHEIKGRIRIHILQSRMTFEQADTLEYYLSNNKLVTSVKVRERLSGTFGKNTEQRVLG